MTEDPRISEIRDVEARHRASFGKPVEPGDLDVRFGIDVNDPEQRYARLLAELKVILDREPPAPTDSLRDIPELWWSPSLGAIRKDPDHDGFRVLGGGNTNAWGWFIPAEWPDDAVRLFAIPPAPRVFFPGDTMPAGVTVRSEFGPPWCPNVDLEASDVLVEVPGPVNEEWQAAVDRAGTEREGDKP